MGLSPKRLAPLFWLTTLAHLAAVVSRFDELSPHLGDRVNGAILFAQFPLLLVAGYFEGKLDYGPHLEDFPLWMRIRSIPVKLSFTFACIFLAVVLFQTFDIGFGPLDPTPPTVWGTSQRAAWYAMFTGGMFFPWFLAASSWLIPATRAVTRPFRVLPSLLAVPLLTAAGIAAGYGALNALTNAGLSDRLAAFHDTLALFKQDPFFAIALTMATVWVPILGGMLLAKKEAEA